MSFSIITRSIRHHCLSFAALTYIGLILLCPFATLGQEPKPGPARAATVPAVKETKLKNGLTVAVIEKRNVPLVTVQLLVRSGASVDGMEKAGLADLTASMLTKGTTARTATQIAEEMEFLGGSIGSGANWNSSTVTISVTSNKLDQAIAIMSDVILNPTFPEAELELLRSQAVDGLTYNLTQPGFLSNYVSSVFSLGEQPAGGTPASLASISKSDITNRYRRSFLPENAVLIFAGDISYNDAVKIAGANFGRWSTVDHDGEKSIASMGEISPAKGVARTTRMLVVDLPNSGQASVSYVRPIAFGRENDEGGSDSRYYAASTLNSLFGGGYSSRLNQEIRIKRGLSYGAGSSFGWRYVNSTFSTRTQTKNESAPEVAELLIAELKRLAEQPIPAAELDPRKAVLTGGFSRNIETTGGLVGALADLYTFELSPTELNKYTTSINAVTERQIRDLARTNLLGGDIIIVGDYAKFKDDLAKRFPDIKPEVIPAAELDISKPNLRK
jgi:zinc protease